MPTNFTQHLQTIWNNSIEPDFAQGLICSEQHLQAFFFKEFNIEGIQAWVEPKLTGKNIKLLENYKPDLLFTQNQMIVGVMELRFSPYYQLEPQNDLYSFQTFLRERHDDPYEIYFKINPENGDFNTQENYQISPDLLFIYGVIAKKGSKALLPEIANQYKVDEFLHLKIEV